jgi:DNA-binding transcriptional MerR regulator
LFALFTIFAIPKKVKGSKALKMEKTKTQKVYYSIKEVAAMYDVKESLLRYWEGVFPHLKPQTTSNKVRQYTQKDIDQIGLIYNLVKVRGFKLAAARKMLNENRDGVDKSAKVMESLIAIREELQLLKKQLDSLS